MKRTLPAFAGTPHRGRWSARLALPLLCASAACGFGQAATGALCGQVSNEKGNAAQHVRIAAIAGSPSSAVYTVTDAAGHYCFNSLAFGSYRVTADDPDARYPPLLESVYSERPLPLASLSAAHPYGTINWRIPYQAAKLQLHVRDAESGEPVQPVLYRLTARRRPEYRTSQGSAASADLPILLPPDEDLVLRVSAPGYKEWHEDRAGGGFLNYASGTEHALEIRLQRAK